MKPVALSIMKRSKLFLYLFETDDLVVREVGEVGGVGGGGGKAKLKISDLES